MKVTLDFHDSSKERPQKSGEYIVLNRGNYTPTVNSSHYSKQHDKFNAHDGDYAGGSKYGVDYEFWAEIPDGFKRCHNV